MIHLKLYKYMCVYIYMYIHVQVYVCLIKSEKYETKHDLCMA